MHRPNPMINTVYLYTISIYIDWIEHSINLRFSLHWLSQNYLYKDRLD